jgi:hypothetical protein
VAAGGVIVILLVLAQLLGPVIAARVIRTKVGRYGTVHSVSVSAWPAIELAWRHADSVTVSAGRLRVSPAQLGSLLEESSGTDRVRVSAEVVELEGLRLTSATFVKHGSALWTRGTISAADIARALPAGVQIALISSSGGQVEVRASGGLFGLSASLDAVAYAQNGALVASPTAFSLSGLRITLYDDRAVYIEGVHARELSPGRGGEARYELSMWGRLR